MSHTASACSGLWNWSRQLSNSRQTTLV